MSKLIATVALTLSDVLDNNVSLLESVLAIDEIEVSLPIHHMGVKCSGNRFLNARAPFTLVIWTVVIRLDIAGSASINTNAPIYVELVVPQVVVIADGGDLTICQLGALGALDVRAISVAGDGVVNVRLEDAKAVELVDYLLSVGQCCIPVGGVVWTIVSGGQATDIDANSIEPIVVRGTSLEWIVSSVLCDSICKDLE